MTDVDIVRRFRESGAPKHRFADESASLGLDVITLTSEETALLILDHILKVWLKAGSDMSHEVQDRTYKSFFDFSTITF